MQNVTTDNAANFTKAITLYQEVADHSSEISAKIETKTIIPINVTEILDNIDQDDNDELIILPPHKNCSNHLLNLVASTYALKAREDKTYQRLYDRAMPKVQALSNADFRITKMNDSVEASGKNIFKDNLYPMVQ